MKKELIRNYTRGELAREISNILLQRIETGYYLPGKKMDSVRQIAFALGVSTVSVQNALKILKEKGVIKSIQGSGIIIDPAYSRELRSGNIAFVFPEIAISPDILQPEDWVINSEIHLGLLRGAELYGAKINFIHVDEKMTPGVLAKKMKEIRENDAAIFVGRELFDIQKTLSKEMPVFNFISEYDKLPKTIIPVCPANREALKSIAKHAKQCNCKKVGILSFVRKNTKKNDPGFQIMRMQQEIFIQFCKEEGLETCPEYNWELHEEERYDIALRDLLKKNPPEFLFCNYSYLVGELYECCRELGIKIGEDMRIMAKSPGLVFSGLKPAVAYMKPPIAELAADTVNYACKCLRGTLKREELLIPKRMYDFIQGASAHPGEK